MKDLWKYTKTLITIVILIFFIYYFINNKGDFLFVLSTPIKYLIVIAILYSVIFFLNGIFIKVILKSFKKKMSVFEAFYLSVISSLGNYFLPMRGGLVYKSVYLKKKFKFPFSHFISFLYGNYIIVFLVNSFLALLALFVIQSKLGVISIPLYVFFGLLFVSMIVLSVVKFPVERIKESRYKFINRVVNIIKNILNGWNIIEDDKRLLFSLILITFAGFTFSTLLFYVEFKALGIDTNFVSVILYTCLSGVSLLVSLTPGSLGIREGIFVITSDILGITNEQVMQLALLDRGVMLISLFFLSGLFLIFKVLLNRDEKFSQREV